MPTTLLTVQTRDMSSAVLERVNAAMMQLTKQMQDQGVTARQALTIAAQQESASTRYASLLERAATASQQYEAAILRVNTAQRQQLDIAASLGTDTQKYTDAVRATNTALEQQASRGQRMVEVNRQLAAAQDQLTTAEQRTSAMMNAPLRAPAGLTTPAETTPVSGASTGSSKTLLGGLQESFLGQYILYGIGYQIGSQLLSGLQSSLTDNQQLSVLAGQTAASTGMGTGGVNWLQTFAENTAGSGTQPYNAQTILTGAYTPLTEFKNKQTVSALTNKAIGMSQISGATDTTTATTALMAMMNGFGFGNNPVGAANTYANLIQGATNTGAYTQAQLAQSLPNANLPALKKSGFSAQFALSAMVAGSRQGISAEQAAQELNSLGQSVANPTLGQQQAARKLGMQIGPGAFQAAGGAPAWLMELQNHMAAMSPALQQQALSQLFSNKDAAAITGAMFAGQGSGSFSSIYNYLGKANQGKGYYQTALSTEQSTPGQKLVDAETKLTQSIDTMTKSLLPIEQQMVTGLGRVATGLDAFLATIPSGKGSNPVSAVIGAAAHAAGIGTSPSSNQSQLDQFGHTMDNLASWLHLSGSGGQSTQGALNSFGGKMDTLASNLGLTGSGNPLGGVGAALGGLGNVISPAHMSAQATAINDAVTNAVRAGLASPSTVTPPRGLASAAGMVSGPSGASPAGAQVTAIHNAVAAAVAHGLHPAGSQYTAQQLQTAAAFKASSVAAGGGGTLAMQNSLDSFKAAMLTYASPQSVEGLYNSYVKAVQADKGLTAPQRQLDIATQQHAFMQYTAGWAKHLVMPPFFNPNPGMGGLNAGFGATAVRFGGGQDPTQALIQKLEQRISQDNTTIKNLLSQIAANTTRTQFNTAHTTPLAGTGTNRSPHS